MSRGWARVEQGSTADGLSELRRGLDAYEKTGARLWRAYFLGLLAQALAKADRAAEGLAAAAEAVDAVRDTREQAFAPELHRVHGELLMATADAAAGGQAKDAFARARAIAKEQRARSWELKVVTSLCTLARDRQERSQTRRLVKETYDWFTEGHETVDLVAARGLLSTSVARQVGE
jgi:predicted ATPase